MEAPTSAPRVPDVVTVRPRPGFVLTPSLEELASRALGYLDTGFPIHFRGPAGTGKTTLALHVANQLGRPVLLVTGDEALTSADLIGGQHGYRYRKVVDRFISTVLKYEEDATQQWVDQRLTTACRHGYTLVYDEFTRSRPETNNPFLTVLEERILTLPAANQRESYVAVHPDFRVIFTSNPEEYTGVHASQDALLDRMVTMDLGFQDDETEVRITASRAGIDTEDARKIVHLVRAFRRIDDHDRLPTLRACIMLARVAQTQGMAVSAANPMFEQACLDILGAKAPTSRQRLQQHEQIRTLVRQHCSVLAKAA